jgi:hypothetical protein
MLVSDPVSSSVTAEGEAIFSHPKVVQIFKSFVGCRCCWLEKEKPCWPSGEQGLKSAKICAYFDYLLGSRVLGSSLRRLVKDMPPSRHTIPV